MQLISPAPEPSLFDFFSVAADVVSAVATVVATIAAVIATRIARAAQRDSEEAARQAEAERFYDAYFADTAIEVIPAFVQTATELIDGRLKELKDLGRQVELAIFDDGLQSLWSDFEKHYLQLRSALVMGLTAYDDSKLTDDFTRALDSLVDEVSALVEGALQKNSPATAGELLQRHGAELLKLVRQHHPSLAEARKYSIAGAAPLPLPPPRAHSRH